MVSSLQSLKNTWNSGAFGGNEFFDIFLPLQDWLNFPDVN